MTSKLEYLKRYGNSSTKKKKGTKGRKSKSNSNFCVVDDDVNWKSTDAKEVNDDPDDAPLVAELQDESVVKWQPLSIVEESKKETLCVDECRSPEDSGPSTGHFTDLSPPRRLLHILSCEEGSDPPQCDDLSPPRKMPPQNNDTSKLKFAGGVLPENEFRKPRGNKQDNVKLMIDTVDASGKFTETIYRGSTKKKDSVADEYVQKKNDEFMQWGRGYVCVVV